MKQLIAPIAIIVALIAFFVVIDRKDFYSTGDVAVQKEDVTRKPTSVTTLKPVEQPKETKPTAETKPVVESKPAETKPVAETNPNTVKPVETKPVAETKPAETKPVVETKSTEVKPTEVKPTETKAVTQTKPVVETKPITETKEDETKPVEKKPAETVAETKSMLVPTAVPVVSAEEAVKLNDFAIFLADIKKTVVEGEIVERSELPDPQKSDYPNCRFTVHFNGNSVKSGEPCPKELSLIIEGFENYRVLPNNDIKTGDKVLCTIFPFDQLPEDYQSTQQADDLELFLLESYYVLDIKTIKSFTDNELMPVSGIYFSDGNEDYISIFDRHINPEIPEMIKEAQKTAILRDLDKAIELLKDYDEIKINDINTQFSRDWKVEKEKDPPGYNRVGNNVWRNIENSFWALPSEYSLLSKPSSLSQNTIDCFLSLKKACEQNGVQLIISLVPDIYVVSSRVINEKYRNIPDLQTATFVKQLSENGIETIYVSDRIIQNYNRFPFAYFFPANGHPGDTTQDCLSDLLVERVKRYGIPSDLDQSLFSATMESSHIYCYPKPYLFPKGCDIGDYNEGAIYVCRHVYYDQQLVKRNKDASIMVIGNSFIQSPMSSPECLPTLIMFKTLSSVDWQNVGGFGPFSDILIRLLSNPDFYLKNKKVLIMQVGTEAIKKINTSGMMLDIAKLDNERVLLNDKMFKGHISLPSNADVTQIVDPELWGPLSSAEKTVLKIDKNNTLTFNIKIEQLRSNITQSKPLILLIPHTCMKNTTCNLCVNGISKPMHSANYPQNQRYFNLAFELPAGTNEISFIFDGKYDTFIAIKDIQIWQ